MEFSKIKINGAEFTAIFTGPQYIFHSGFFGLVAVAERVTDTENIGEGCEKFVLLVGNSQTVGGSFTDSVISAAVKKFIRKSENKYVATACEFSEVHDDLNRKYIKIDVLNY